MNKDIGRVLKKKRIESGISVKEISKILTEKGYKASEKTIYSWENGNSHPNPDALLEMCDAYGIDDILSTFGYNGYREDGSIQLNMKETDLIEKYRFIAQYSPKGIETIEYILNREYDIAKQTKESVRPRVNSNVRYIQYYHRLASAGTGQFLFDDIPVDLIEIPDIPEYRKVKYAVGVNGDSMEPLYNDGDVLLVEPDTDLSIGEIGIFIVDGDSFVKKLGKKVLVSLNKKYSDIPMNEDTECLGRVIDKVDYSPSERDLKAMEIGKKALLEGVKKSDLQIG